MAFIRQQTPIMFSLSLITAVSHVMKYQVPLTQCYVQQGML